MVSVLVSILSSSGSNPGLRYCVVLCYWARYYTLTVPLYTQVLNGYGKFNAWGSPVMD